MTPEQAAEKFILCNGLDDFQCTEALTKELISLIHAQRAEAVAEAQKWRPIETAPKEGASILVWSTVYDVFGGEYERWVILRWIEGFGWEFGASPTHWMPLPPAPQEGEG